uniref:Uncharacterized protein n=1 Tax=Trypanosoma vivax (strain Y486) TaxID=1055687 RepID=G0UBR1_TRYVY|nr:hypothetical protein TVY486_1107430 [Trypanosoma vivax Y486]
MVACTPQIVWIFIIIFSFCLVSLAFVMFLLGRLLVWCFPTLSMRPTATTHDAAFHLHRSGLGPPFPPLHLIVSLHYVHRYQHYAFLPAHLRLPPLRRSRVVLALVFHSQPPFPHSSSPQMSRSLLP